MNQLFSWRRLRRGAALTGALLILGAAIAGAHHGWSNYDETKTLDFQGTIRESSYANPHGTLRLEVEGKTWNVILAPPSRMERRGLKSEMLSSERTVRVVGYPHRDTADELRAERIEIDGKTFELR